MPSRRTLLLTTTLLAFALAACAARATDQPPKRGADTANAADSGSASAPAVQPSPTTAATAGAEAGSTTSSETSGKGSVVPAVAAVEWPQWRGPNRDGLAAGVAPPAAWP